MWNGHGGLSRGQKHSWFLDQLRMLQVPHGAGMEAMRIEVKTTYRTTSFYFVDCLLISHHSILF